jgi:hypothetical protein
MKETDTRLSHDDRRSEPRSLTDRYYSVEFSSGGSYTSYQFKLRDVSTQGACILVKEGSQIMSELKVGEIVEMTYYEAGNPNPAYRAKTKICHITREEEGRYMGHCLVGLSVLDQILPEGDGD